jgi:hypothetical protein
MIIPETYTHTYDGIPRSKVEAFSNTVKRTIETASENVTIYGYHSLSSPMDPARMSGRTGRTQGARIVSIPAIKAVSASVVI